MQRYALQFVCFMLTASIFGCGDGLQQDKPTSVNPAPTGHAARKAGHLPSPNDVEPDIVENLRGQLESDDEQDRIGAIKKLAKVRDAASLGKMIESLEYPNPVVRQQAYDSVGALAGVYFPFDATQPPGTQHKAIAFYKEFWKRFKDPDGPYMQMMKYPELKRTKYADPSAWDNP